MQKLVFDHKPTSLQPKSDESRKRRLRGPMVVGMMVLIGLVLFLLPIVSDPYTISLLYTLFIYVALAQSWNLLGGYTGLVSLGQAAFFGLGAYAAALLLTFTGMPFFVSIIVSGLVATAFAVAIAVPVFRFRGIYFAIGTPVLPDAFRLWMTNGSLTVAAQGFNLPPTN